MRGFGLTMALFLGLLVNVSQSFTRSLTTSSSSRSSMRDSLRMMARKKKEAPANPMYVCMYLLPGAAPRSSANNVSKLILIQIFLLHL
jgi:hypothetical protein